jgi:hypothetical protein
MWWDTVNNCYFVYDGERWVEAKRVLAGTLRSGGILSPVGFISQVGLNTAADAGFILTDSFGNVFRDNQGNLLTTDTPLTSADTGSLVKLDGAQILVQANENIPKFSLIYLIGGRAALASGIPPDNIAKAPVAICTTDAYQNDVITITPAGKTVSFDQWSWDISTWGKTVYCGPHGEVTLTRPESPKNVRVGTIISAQSVLLNFDWETDAAVAASGISGIAVQAPLVVSGQLSTPVISMPRATEVLDGFMNSSDFARIPALETVVALKADITHTQPISSVLGLQTSLDGKAPLIHAHAISDVNGLQLALDNKANTVHTHAVADITDIQPIFININTALNSKMPMIVGGTVGNFTTITASGTVADSYLNAASFALASHTHAMVDIIELSTALNGKAALVHTHIISDVGGLQLALDDKANLIHSHVIDDVAGLADALAGKAPTIHVHAIADVAGLQSTLDGKANTIHSHSIAEVTGLQTALDGKSAIGHIHGINEVTGLQIVLDSKADVVHAHVIADITDLQPALDLKANVNHTQLASTITDFVNASYIAARAALVPGPNVTITPNDVNMTLTISSNGGAATWPFVSPNGAIVEEASVVPDAGGLVLRGKTNTSVMMAVGGNNANSPAPSASILLSDVGEIKITGMAGAAGQVLTSGGAGAAAHWADSIGTISLTQDEIAYGTVGNVATSSANLGFKDSDGSFTLNVNASSNPTTTPGQVRIGAPFAPDYQTQINQNIAGDITLLTNNLSRLRISSYGEFFFNEVTDPAVATNTTDTNVYTRNGYVAAQPYFESGGNLAVMAGKSDDNSPIAIGGAIGLYAGGNFNYMSDGARIQAYGGGTGSVDAPDDGGGIFLHSGSVGWYDTTPYSQLHNLNRTSGTIVVSTGDVYTGASSSGGAITWASGDITLATGAGSGADPINIGRIKFAPGNRNYLAIGPNGEIEMDPNGPASDAVQTWNAGNIGQVLTSHGAGSPVYWADVSAPLLKVANDNANAFLNFGQDGHHNGYFRSTLSTPVEIRVKSDGYWIMQQTESGSTAAPMPVGGYVWVVMQGTGTVTVVADDTAVIINSALPLTISTQFSKLKLIKVGPNEWDVAPC